MQKSFAFNAVPVDGGFDREYLVEELLEYFADLFSHGISPFVANNLQVIANGDMSVTLRPGVLWDANGCKYKNTSDLVVNLSPADGLRDRIDRICITWMNAERDMRCTVQEGVCAYNPVAPECRRNANYRDYVVADVLVRSGAVNITQANITDQRLNSGVCGMAAGLLQQFNPDELFIQISEYFSEFKEQTGISYAQFMEVMESYIENLKKDGSDLYDSFNEEISGYIADLKAKGDADLATLTQQLINFRDTNEAKFLEWFESIKGVFSTDAAAGLLLEIDKLNEQVEDMEGMLLSGKIMAKLITGDGKYLIDDMGKPLLADRPICACNS